ncbi:GL24244 [Drosophila persimilis]|uniref:procollagen-proline 4-dioxygenase n=1 Tax=Drosophila persimilis TaxID=7234 RepID=B4G4W1_DROPE|nr:prolyl 4-hydroxylase subunit alpha-2 [Drosophila persimilis]EDW24627.1 GL24244 [Drosophila persimilis]
MLAVRMISPYWLLLWLGLGAGEEQHYATSTRHLAFLLQVEDELLATVRQYAVELQQKVDTMRALQAEWMARRVEARADPVSYVANPLRSLPLIRRMHVDARKWLDFARLEVGQEPLQQLADFDLSGISPMDFKEAADGLLRIQEIYDLDERDMARGKLRHKHYNSRLNSADCLALGVHLEDLQKGRLSGKWLEVALEQYEDKWEPIHRLLQVGRSQIWQQLGLTLISTHDLQGSHAAFTKAVEGASESEDVEIARHLADNLGYHFVHQRNCQGRSRLPVQSSLRCHYSAEGSAFLRLAPLRMELLSRDPLVALYHEVVSAAEQRHLMLLSESQLQRQRGHQYDKIRTFASASVAANATPTVEQLHRRLEDITGLDLAESEPLRILNYGIGGQYYIHVDCEQPQTHVEPYPKEYRLATVLLYLSDVRLGGFTSFPALGLGIRPNRGSALVWHNANNAGNCDYRALHAACPVLLGTRWVASKWISGSGGQWRRKPCRK